MVIVFGGSGLIGRELILGLVKNGYQCVNIDYQNHNVLKAIPFFKCDVLNNEISHVIESIEEAYGQINAVINCLYIRNKSYGLDVLHTTQSSFEFNIAKNLSIAFEIMKVSLSMKRTEIISVINVSSVYGVISPRFEIYEGVDFTNPVDYSAIKAGLIHLTKYFARYAKGKKIRFNCISPGGVYDNHSEQFVNSYSQYTSNIGMILSEDLLGSIEFLISNKKSRAVNGLNLIVDDGFSL
ncbi:SDR family oxidoreductase [Schleiferiaceae bacterium]|nr:SDR family oxidoreductase [Schleiferiaceae bacterium]